MTFQNPPGYEDSFRRQAFPNFGRWVYTTDAGSTLNYIEYDTTKTNNKKIITKGMPLKNKIVGVSADFSCVLTLDDVALLFDYIEGVLCVAQ